MTRYEAQNLALQLMDKHNLLEKGWRFEFSNKKRAFGTCFYRKRVISLSQYLLPTINAESIKDIILHEIAHALDLIENGYSSGHGANWKRIAVRIGASPTRTKSYDNKEALKELATESKYTLTCPNGHTSPAHRRPKRRKSCGRCSRVFDERYILKITQNY